MMTFIDLLLLFNIYFDSLSLLFKGTNLLESFETSFLLPLKLSERILSSIFYYLSERRSEGFSSLILVGIFDFSVSLEARILPKICNYF